MAIRAPDGANNAVDPAEILWTCFGFLTGAHHGLPEHSPPSIFNLVSIITLTHTLYCCVSSLHTLCGALGPLEMSYAVKGERIGLPCMTDHN